jgi:hypothetical protein
MGVDDLAGGSLAVVGDDDGGLVVAEPGDGELAEGSGVAGEGGVGVFPDFGAVVAVPVEGDGFPLAWGDLGDAFDKGLLPDAE